jgi:spore coat polysaccharide biosynthesis protein SpsF
MKVVAIIQARMGSTRLPGKVLKNLCGQSVLARVVNRTRRARLLNEVVVATTDQPADDAVVRESGRLSIPCFRGNEADVLDRYYRAAQHCAAESVVRITSDCPLIDPELIDATIQAFLYQKADYATNSLVITYPRGLDVEVLTAEALGSAWHEALESYQRAHVTPYLYEHPERFQIASLTSDEDLGHHRWTLDTPEDWELIEAIYTDCSGGRDDFSWRQVLELLRRKPQLAEINSHVQQKAIHEG